MSDYEKIAVKRMLNRLKETGAISLDAFNLCVRKLDVSEETPMTEK